MKSTLSLAGSGPSAFGIADLGASVNEKVAALLLGGTPQSFFSKLTIELAPQIKNRMAV